MTNNAADGQALGKLEGKLDIVLQLLTEVRSDQKEVAGQAIELATQMRGSADHEKRIQQLENDKSYVKGWIRAAGLAGGLVGGIAGVILGWIFNYVPHSVPK